MKRGSSFPVVLISVLFSLIVVLVAFYFIIYSDIFKIGKTNIDEFKDNEKIGCKNDVCYTIYNLNGDSSDKIDILFVPIDYNNLQDFLNAIEKNIDYDSKNRGLLYFEPFKSNKDIFNYYYISQEEIPFQEGYLKYIEQGCWVWGNFCDSNFIPFLDKWINSFNDIDYYIVLHNDAQKGMRAIPPGKKGITAPGIPDGTLNHELGHQFGFGEHYNTGDPSSLLINTYEDALNDPNHPIHEAVQFDLAHESSVGGLIPPNCDEIGCPLWCKGYIKEPIFPIQIAGGNNETCIEFNTREECLNSKWTNEFGVEITSDDYCTWVGESLYNNGEPYFGSKCIPHQDDYQNFIDIGINCREGTGCYYGCNGDGGWRATADGGIMKDHLNAEGYDPIEIEVIKNYIYKKYGIIMN